MIVVALCLKKFFEKDLLANPIAIKALNRATGIKKMNILTSLEFLGLFSEIGKQHMIPWRERLDACRRVW